MQDVVEPRTLVVGTDGSAHAVAALRWAVDEVLARGGHVRVVSAWHRDPGHPDGTEAREHALRLAEETVQSVAHAAVDVTIEVVEGLASTVLVQASRDADLLVIGSLGLEARRRVVLGSVSARCALYSFCPVVVVPAPDRVDRECKRCAAVSSATSG